MSKPRAIAEPDFLRQPARRSATIVNLPVTALSEDSDPTADLRNLIEQLHRTAQDARAQVQATEQEKELAANQLEMALAELHTARDREVELRSRFVEITSLIKERDVAVNAAQQHARTISDLQRKLDAAKRERESA